MVGKPPTWIGRQGMALETSQELWSVVDMLARRGFNQLMVYDALTIMCGPTGTEASSEKYYSAISVAFDGE